MLDILDEASLSDDTDEVTELQSTSLTSATASIVHTKLGSPKPDVTTLKEFMEVSTGLGNPLPRTFQGKLETFLNNFCAVNHPSSHTRYMRVQKENKVMRFILIIYGLLIRGGRLWNSDTCGSTMSLLWTGRSRLISSAAMNPSMVDHGMITSWLQQKMVTSLHASCAFSR